MELETKVKSLEAQVNEQEDSTTEIVSKWQESCAASEEKCTMLQMELVRAEEKCTMLQAELVRAEEKSTMLRVELDRVLLVKDDLEVSMKGFVDQTSSESLGFMLQQKEEELQKALQELDRSNTAEATLKGVVDLHVVCRSFNLQNILSTHRLHIVRFADHVARLEDDIKSNQELFRQREDGWDREISLLLEKCTILEKHKENESALAEDLKQVRFQLEENVVARKYYEGNPWFRFCCCLSIALHPVNPHLHFS